MTIKVLRDHCIFILLVTIFLSSCQLTTTGEKKSVLDESLNTEEQAQSLTEKDVTEEEPNEEFAEEPDEDLYSLRKNQLLKNNTPLKNLMKIFPQLKKLKTKKEF